MSTKPGQAQVLSDIIAPLERPPVLTDGLTDQDLINYAHTILHKGSGNERVMNQIASNSSARALLGDFPNAPDEAVMERGETHRNPMMQCIDGKKLQVRLQRVALTFLSRGASRIQTIKTAENRLKGIRPLGASLGRMRSMSASVMSRAFAGD